MQIKHILAKKRCELKVKRKRDRANRCMWCRQLRSPGIKLCPDHALKKRARARQAIADRDPNLCCKCPAPHLPHLKYCAACLERNREACRRSGERRKLRQGSVTPCVRCGRDSVPGLGVCTEHHEVLLRVAKKSAVSKVTRHNVTNMWGVRQRVAKVPPKRWPSRPNESALTSDNLALTAV